MDQREFREYEKVIEGLLYLNSSLKIKEAISGIEGINKTKLGEAFRIKAQEFLNEKRKDEYEILQFIYGVLKDDLEQDSSKEEKDPLLIFVQSAINQPNSIVLRSYLTRNKHLVTEDFLGYLHNEAADSNSPSHFECVLTFCTASIVSGSPEWKIKAYIFWSTELRRNKKLSKAETYLNRARGLLSITKDKTLITLVLSAQAGFYRSKKDFKKAIELFEELIEKNSPSDAPLLINMHQGVAQVCMQIGQYSRALDHLNLLISILERYESLYDRKINAYEDRGLTQEHLGRYEKGFMDYQTAFTLATHAGNRGRQFANLNNMAASLAKRGLYQKSLDKFLEIMQTVSNWGNPNVISAAHNNLGSSLLNLDRPAEALVHFQKAFQVKINSGDKNGEFISLIGLADCHRKLNNDEVAGTFLTLASMTALESYDVGLIVQYVTRSIDDKHLDSGEKLDFETLNFGLDVAKKEGNVFFEMVLINLLCEAYSKNDDKKRALAVYESFFNERPDVDRRSTEYLTTLIKYCSLLLTEPDKHKTALQLLLNALSTVEKEIDQVDYDYRKAEIISSSIALYSKIIELVTTSNQLSANGEILSKTVFTFNLHESAKARSYLENFSGSFTISDSDIPAHLLEEELRLLHLEWEYNLEGDEKGEVYRFNKLKQTKLELKNCWEKMKAFSTDYVRFRTGDPYTFDEVQEILKVKTLSAIGFVSFFCDEESTTVFAFKSGFKEPKVFRCKIGKPVLIATIQRLNRVFNGAPFEFPPYPPILRDKPERRSLDFLYELSEPLLQFLSCVSDAEVLCLAPHGPLHRIPFHALKMKDGEYLANRFCVSYVPSISSLMMLLKRSKAIGLPNNPSVLFSGVSSDTDLNPEIFEREVDFFDNTAYSVTSKVGAKDASREAIVEALPNFDIVHLSCHGHFNRHEPDNSGLLFSNGYYKPSRDPSNIPITIRRDFLLTVKDILNTPIEAQLVTLNACSTGVQEQINEGDELNGFNRALLLSGASSVVTTLWNVDQEYSGQFFNFFYLHLATGGDPIEKWMAFNKAQRQFINSENKILNHPYHWAAFTLNGNWK